MTLAPPSLNFLAGLFAGAGINLVTSVATGPVGSSTTKIVVDAALWVAAAGLLTWAAHLVDTADRKAERLITVRLNEDEDESIRSGYLTRVHGTLTILFCATAAAALLAVVLLLL